MFQNKFEIKLFENGGDIDARVCWKKRALQYLM